MLADILLALSFSLAFISIVAIFFTDKKILFSIIALVLFAYFYKVGFDRGEADLITIICFISGILLLVIELITPSFGILGSLGLVLTIYSLMDSLNNSLFGIIVLMITAASVFISITLFIKLGFSAKVFEKSILTNVQTKERGYNSKKDYSFLLEKSGNTLSILRPTGRIEIDEKIYDARTYGEFIKKDVGIKVVEIKDGNIYVKEDI
ncbi:MAG: NfeD family protein [Anaerococcus hydrogenalis]|uniref:NfeD family protein n=1 Tax=Anaerococcus hydrogenalis TaxID=33029 RepID=UPI002904B351|nr:NfeD family protein [Anaerococcus hydrogenalis]MDU1316771.1 NfeD family protein [Anaerococcus hydrogenalis]MDU2583199.1 NfeD family protein [Anaerococcus hydrogenalis]MDU3687753.1 NfeD family protein [Anaerococcus hydrogenalis]